MSALERHRTHVYLENNNILMAAFSSWIDPKLEEGFGTGPNTHVGKTLIWLSFYRYLTGIQRNSQFKATKHF